MGESTTGASEIEAAQAEGWQVKSQNSDSVVMTKKAWGSWKVHVPLFITFGVGNLIYGLWRRFISPHKKTIEWDGGLLGRDEPLECRRCGDTVKYVATKCPHCGFRGKTGRKDRKQAAWGMATIGLLIWPLLLVAPFMWLAAYVGRKEGVAPFEDMSRAEWRRMSQQNR